MPARNSANGTTQHEAAASPATMPPIDNRPAPLPDFVSRAGVLMSSLTVICLHSESSYSQCRPCSHYRLKRIFKSGVSRMKAADGLPIGALSKESGVNIETIRYYERIGVMPKPRRSAGGYRIYGPDHLKRLTFVRRGRELGFSLDELRGLLLLVDGHAYTCAEVHALAVEHVAAIRRKIA